MSTTGVTVTIRADMSKYIEALERLEVATRRTRRSVGKLTCTVWFLRFREGLDRRNRARLADVWP